MPLQDATFKKVNQKYRQRVAATDKRATEIRAAYHQQCLVCIARGDDEPDFQEFVDTVLRDGLIFQSQPTTPAVN